MKEQKFAIKLNFTGICIEDAVDVLVEYGVAENYSIEHNSGKRITLEGGHFLATGFREMDTEKMARIDRHNLRLVTPYIELDEVPMVVNLMKSLYERGARCIESFPAATIDFEEKNRRKNQKLRVLIEDELSKSVLLHSLFFFEPLKLQYVDYYHRGKLEKMAVLNDALEKFKDNNSDVYLYSGPLLSSLNRDDSIKKAIW